MGLNDLYQRYGDDFEFVHVYVKEPHGKDLWWLGTRDGKSDFFADYIMGGHGKAAIDIKTAETFGDRCEAAKRLEKELNYQIPIVVDGMDDAVNDAYLGMPVRLYLIGDDGKVLYDCGKGPGGFSQNGIQNFEQALNDYLKTHK